MRQATERAKKRIYALINWEGEQVLGLDWNILFILFIKLFNSLSFKMKSFFLNGNQIAFTYQN